LVLDAGGWPSVLAAHGNLTVQTDPRDVTAVHSYDPIDRLAFTDYTGTDLDTRW